MAKPRRTPAEIGGAARRESLGLVYIQVEMTREEKKALQHKAIDEELSMSALVRRLIREHCGLK